MDGSTWLWIALAIVVVVLLIAVALAGTRKQRTRRIEKADTIREDAAEDATIIAQRENKAQEMDARARAAQAEAEAKTAEAERLSATAERRQAAVSDDRSQLDERLRSADELDPRVSDDAAARRENE